MLPHILLLGPGRPQLVLQTVLVTMWATWGVVPAVLTGHSFRKYAALMCECCCATPSAMAALQLPLPAVCALLSWQCTTRVELACVNPTECMTIAGTPANLCTFNNEVRRMHPGTC